MQSSAPQLDLYKTRYLDGEQQGKKGPAHYSCKCWRAPAGVGEVTRVLPSTANPQPRGLARANCSAAPAGCGLGASVSSPTRPS